jgi:hypothetical protein
VCPQTFIVQTLIISNSDNHPIYMERKEGARELAARETDRERESVCVRERGRIAENGGSVSCKNGHWRNGPFGISQDQNRRTTFIVRNYFEGRDRLRRLYILLRMLGDILYYDISYLSHRSFKKFDEITKLFKI